MTEFGTRSFKELIRLKEVTWVELDPIGAVSSVEETPERSPRLHGYGERAASYKPGRRALT